MIAGQVVPGDFLGRREVGRSGTGRQADLTLVPRFLCHCLMFIYRFIWPSRRSLDSSQHFASLFLRSSAG